MHPKTEKNIPNLRDSGYNPSGLVSYGEPPGIKISAARARSRISAARAQEYIQFLRSPTHLESFLTTFELWQARLQRNPLGVGAQSEAAPGIYTIPALADSRERRMPRRKNDVPVFKKTYAKKSLF